MSNRLFQLGYVIGLIVGEGSFTTHGKRRRRFVPVLEVKLHEDDPEPLLALARSFGGKLYGPYRTSGKDGGVRRFRVWILRGRALTRLLPTLDKVLPPSKKREQFHMWMREHGFDRAKEQTEMFHVPHSKKSSRIHGVAQYERASKQLRLLG